MYVRECLENELKEESVWECLKKESGEKSRKGGYIRVEGPDFPRIPTIWRFPAPSIWGRFTRSADLLFWFSLLGLRLLISITTSTLGYESYIISSGVVWCM